jgi:hypothetical protein
MRRGNEEIVFNLVSLDTCYKYFACQLRRTDTGRDHHADSDTTDGDAADGDAADGDTTDGDTTDGDATDSNATDSDGTSRPYGHVAGYRFCLDRNN